MQSGRVQTPDLIPGGGGEEVLPYTALTGMCGQIGYDFQAFLS